MSPACNMIHICTIFCVENIVRWPRDALHLFKSIRDKSSPADRGLKTTDDKCWKTDSSYRKGLILFNKCSSTFLAFFQNYSMPIFNIGYLHKRPIHGPAGRPGQGFQPLVTGVCCMSCSDLNMEMKSRTSDTLSVAYDIFLQKCLALKY